MPTNRTAILSPLLFAALLLLFTNTLSFAQSTVCSPVPAHELSPADTAYKQAKYELAESLYQRALQQQPNDSETNAALVHTLLREDRISDASSRANSGVEQAPRSAPALTALAEVQLRQGQPWLASQTLDTAAAADPCFARVHLIRSRIDRIDSMYASERSELEAAYRIDPVDPDIHRAWAHTVNPADDIVRIEDSLATMTDLDAATRQKARASADNMLTLLSENSQTCQTIPATSPVILPLSPSYENAKQVSGYKLAVQFPKGSAKLTVDTAASGLYISQKLADSLGLQHADGAPPGTVQADTLRIGQLEFRNCMVGVSDSPFAEGIDGFIGTDVFASYLVALNFPEARLELDPLPRLPGEAKSDLPGDRYSGPELRAFTPVYHKNQYLLVPVLLNNKSRRLFVLDTGIRLSTMTLNVAHSVSDTRLNFTNSIKTVSGSTLQLYRDGFDLQFANLAFDHKDHILEYDLSAINQSAGMEVAGMLGFDILQSMVMHIDYRDGLVQFNAPASVAARPVGPTSASTTTAGVPAAQACTQYAGQNGSHPLNTAVRATTVDGLDSARLKPGQAVRAKMIREWTAASCTLNKGALLYGHVVASASAKTSGNSELAVVFDHGDCAGHPKQELVLRIISVSGDDAGAAVHNAMPTEVRGGARAISDTAASMGSYLDEDTHGGRTVQTGAVTGIKHLKLIPDGGPQCSAMLTSDQRSVQVDPGTEFIMTMQAGALD